jgi:hypothetical protein
MYIYTHTHIWRCRTISLTLYLHMHLWRCRTISSWHLWPGACARENSFFLAWLAALEVLAAEKKIVFPYFFFHAAAAYLLLFIRTNTTCSPNLI